MPEYGVWTSRVIRVKRAPGSGFMPNIRSTVTCAWPAPSSTTSLRMGCVEINARPSRHLGSTGAAESRVGMVSILSPLRSRRENTSTSIESNAKARISTAATSSLSSEIAAST